MNAKIGRKLQAALVKAGLNSEKVSEIQALFWRDTSKKPIKLKRDVVRRIGEALTADKTCVVTARGKAIRVYSIAAWKTLGRGAAHARGYKRSYSGVPPVAQAVPA